METTFRPCRPRTGDARHGLLRDACLPRRCDGAFLYEAVFAAAGERAVLLIIHRGEGLDLVDDIVEIP
jgi:hypothetical protein